MSMANNPYLFPRTHSNPEKDVRAVRYSDGTQAHRGDRVLDGRGRSLTVIGINARTGRVMAVDAGWHMVGIDPLEVEVVERDE